MVKAKKIIGIVIIIIFIIAIICGFTIYFLNQKDNKETADIYKKIDDEQEEIERTGNYEVQKLGNLQEFLSVEKCIQENIDEKFEAKMITFIEKENSLNFAVYGLIENEEKYFLLLLDTENNTFSIDELKNVENIDNINLNTDITEIKNNGKNEFEYLEMDEEDIARKYLEIFSKLEIEHPKEAYRLLDENYKKEKYPSFEDYEKYVDEYKEIIENAVLSKYSIDFKDNYTEYILVDNYNNSYTLRTTSAMEYTVMLDNYTIKVDDYQEKYSKLSDEGKVEANVYIFLQMINTKDYKHAYEILDNKFKENNFDTVDKFEEYVKNNFFNYNLNNYSGNIQTEGSNFVYNTQVLSDSSSAASKKNLTIVMKLKEGTDFVMSFNVEDVND